MSALNQYEKDFIDTKSKLLGSLLYFTQTFYKLRTGRDFELSCPAGRESHYISICKELTDVFYGKCRRLIINVPPRYGKTELLIHFVAWTLAHYPDSNYLYLSYGLGLAKKQTQTIRQIIGLPHYKKLFGVDISIDTSAKDNFETSSGGTIIAAGAGGTITGRGAGIRGVQSRFGGCVIMDDMHKPDEVMSDTMREHIIEWYGGTLMSRVNEPMHTPIIYIGQRLHEADLCSKLLEDSSWKSLVIAALDEAGNALNPKMHPKEELLKMQENEPYVFASQYQQNPQPAGGGIFKPEWFYLTEEDPQMILTFITGDTAETDKSYNDATVFSFWGIYKIKDALSETNSFGLHLIFCEEIRVEPKDLQSEFEQFYANCLRYKVKPSIIALEKKSTGTTLLSILHTYRGIRVIDIERTKASGNKTTRFLEIQPYVAQKLISLNRHAKHTSMFIEHMRKITANNTHRFDDIADTLYDAIKLALIDKILTAGIQGSMKDDEKARFLMSSFNRYQNIQGRNNHGYR